MTSVQRSFWLRLSWGSSSDICPEVLLVTYAQRSLSWHLSWGPSGDISLLMTSVQKSFWWHALRCFWWHLSRGPSDDTCPQVLLITSVQRSFWWHLSSGPSDDIRHTYDEELHLTSTNLNDSYHIILSHSISKYPPGNIKCVLWISLHN